MSIQQPEPYSGLKSLANVNVLAPWAGMIKFYASVSKRPRQARLWLILRLVCKILYQLDISNVQHLSQIKA
jgi:hypothetical protein